MARPDPMDAFLRGALETLAWTVEGPYGLGVHLNGLPLPEGTRMVLHRERPQEASGPVYEVTVELVGTVCVLCLWDSPAAHVMSDEPEGWATAVTLPTA